MSKVQKKICLFLTVILVLSSFIIPVYSETDQASTRNRKLVSIVYDDSGSMLNEKWEYTSYAIQCFAAMLNKEDKLDITYMSSYTQGSFSVDTGDRDASVKKIREHNQSGGTPLESIDTAFNTLKGNNDTNVNTQYWLIVITDGQIADNETTAKKINGMAETKMPNGTKPQVVFMTICDTDNQFTPSFSKSNINCERVLTADAVVDAISDVACDISGRYAVSEDDITFVDDKTVKVRADVPLLHIGVLAQRTDASVKQIVDSEGQTLNMESDVHVELPQKCIDYMSDEDKKALRGNVSLFNASSGNILPDTYTITFTDKISKKDLVIMFEPAIELRIEVFVNDARIDDLSTLVADQTVDFKASLYEIGTSNKILPSMLPSGLAEQISLSENGKIVVSEKDLLLEDVVLKEAPTEVTATVEIPGFFTVKDTISFTPKSIKISGITASIYYDGSERQINKDGSRDAENVVYITELDSNETGVKFTLYIDDKPIDKSQAIAIKDLFIEGLNLDFNNYKVSVCNDGGIVVSPTSTWVPSFIYWIMHHGDSAIEVNCGGKTASEVICFKIGDLKTVIIELMVLLLLIYLIYWIFGKQHFRKPGSIKLFEARKVNGEYTQNFGATKRISWLSASNPLNFIGPGGMKKKVGKFYIKAAKGGYELIGVKGCYVSTSIKYPCAAAGVSQSKKKFHRFTSSIYVYDNDKYYKISMTNGRK